MKTLIAITIILSSLNAMAADVLSARLDSSRQNIVLEVKYGGGCKVHNFSIELGGCFETFPVSCQAVLVEKIVGGFDGCEAIRHETVVINLEEYGLTDSYFEKAHLTINGTGPSFNGETSSVSVTLP